MQQKLGKHQQLRLLGKTEWMMLRAHTLKLEKTLRPDKDIIQWKDGVPHNDRIHRLLDALTKADSKLCRLQSAWGTLKWVCEQTGYEKAWDMPDL